MSMIGVRIAAVWLALAVLCLSPPAHAYGLRVGPLYLPLPFAGGYHQHRRPDSEAPPAKLAQNGAPELIFAVLAWPSFIDDVFRPTNFSAWPFSYQSIFDQAFAKYPPERTADLCPRRIAVGDIALRIGRQVALTAAQRPLLQKLGGALAQAEGYLIKSCPSQIPPQPIDRLQLMETQIDTVTMALEIVRPPLQKFEQSLNDKQRTAFAARTMAASTVDRDAAPTCAAKLEPANWPLPVLEQTVQPTPAQQEAVAKLQRALARAASDLAADCPDGVPRMPSARLQAIESRLDTTWDAVQTIQVGLAQFRSQLNDQQSARFNDLEIAAAR
ncbi:MAG TPA: Spy/CpxP family protein refolding chaperone [Xanthobacteraceae bacterium]|nr:Spy/CpxP family protein refolding chaperone [Xanthobacteraceae bacterium]